MKTKMVMKSDLQNELVKLVNRSTTWVLNFYQKVFRVHDNAFEFAVVLRTSSVRFYLQFGNSKVQIPNVIPKM